MKKLLLCFIIFSKSNFVLAQSCNVIDEFNPSLANTLTEAEYNSFPWTTDSTFLDNYYNTLVQQFGNPAARTDVESVWLRVPVTFWVYREDDGGQGTGNDLLPTEVDFQRMLDDANNSHYDNGINFRYYINSIQFINNSSWVVPSNRIQRLQIAYLNRLPNTMNVHVVQGGGSEFFWDTNAIFIERNVYLSAAAAETFTHEVGHFFGLLHTHFGYNVPCFREPVSRGVVANPCPPFVSKRCMHTGDLLCNTSADPNMLEGTPPAQLPRNNNCTYVRGQTDFYGRTYQPDVRNYMAYANAGCGDVFSSAQKKVMNWFAFYRGLAGNTWLANSTNQFDRFEPDDADIAARPIQLNASQAHSFHSAGRVDLVDWYSFQYTSTNAPSIYRIEVSNIAGFSNPVNEVNVFIRQANGTAGARLLGLNTFFSNGVRVVEIPCNLLTLNQNYLVEVRAGSSPGRYNFLLTGNGNPQISGPSLLCSSSIFALTNLSPNSSVSWSVSPSGLVSPNSGTSVNAGVSKISNGNATITFTISSCSSSGTISKSFHTGPYSSSDYPVSGPSSVCRNGVYAYFNTASLNGATNYQWIYPSSWTYVSGQGTNYLALRTNCSSTSGVVGVRVDNTCGSGGSVNTKYVNVTSCGSCYSYSYSPNPVASTLKIQLEPDFVSAEKAVTDYEVSLISSKQKAVFITCTNNKSIEIQTEDFPNGLYYLIVNFGDRIEKSQILINH